MGAAIFIRYICEYCMVILYGDCAILFLRLPINLPTLFVVISQHIVALYTERLARDRNMCVSKNRLGDSCPDVSDSARAI